MAGKNQKPSEETPTFEEALESLELIVGRMEEEKLPLDELILEYEKGVSLSKLCAQKLDAAEQKVRLIGSGPDGEPELTPFDPEAHPEPSKNKATPDQTDEITLF